MTEIMTLSQLEGYLASAADLLRGSIDQADFKAFIFPMMFFKRLSDVYDAEYVHALTESDGDDEYARLPENHHFDIPRDASWESVRQTTVNVGQALVRAFRAIESANPKTLAGIFGNAPWTNKAKLSDDKLLDLIEHFSTKNLSNEVVAPDVFGQAYEYLIKRFADLSRKKAGEYYTPRSVVRLMVGILDPQPGEDTYDPACGTAGMLLEVIAHTKEQGHDPRLLWGHLFGQDKTLTTASIARMNLLLHGVPEFTIVREDTLRNPAFLSGGKLQQFDNVIANPPFSLEDWGPQAWASDPYGRNKIGGVPPEKNADWAWIQHMMASAKPGTGRVAVVVPQGALFRGGAEARIRSEFLGRDLIEAVIGMAPNLFYGTGLAPAIMVLRTSKPQRSQGKVLFINADHLFTKGRNQNSLSDSHANEILAAYQGFADIEGFARVVSLDDIHAEADNLNITRYVTRSDDTETLTMEQALANLLTAWEQVEESRASLEEQLALWGLSAEDLA
ncbi:DNA methylase [Boudabousia liubingyangii]|uniref:type I restriction-modification system subunit M n=1 Tax=Boudabousia liubingyangii TaxID=1921764 RepID=UPI00093E3D35|nr:class I SAM-dependent DNA methyltransferase [Boudabousia liubingyangii]OKL46270.1 DNA methylase [Boudabousia liubingyangii]